MKNVMLSKFVCGFDFLFLDLVPKENVERWIQCLQLEFPVVAFKASTQIQDKTVVRGALYNSVFQSCRIASVFGCIYERKASKPYFNKYKFVLIQLF